MSINNIQLTPFLIQELFSKSLVEMDSPVPGADMKSATSFSYLGNNRKKIALVIADAATLYLPDDELNFLLGILSACNLTMEHVAIVNIAKNTDFTYKSIEAELKAQQIILFGVSAEQISLPVTFPNYQVQSFNNQIYLAAAALPAIQNDKAEKAKLWNALKQLFSI